MLGTEEKKYWAELQQGKMDSLGKLYDLFVDELFAYGMCVTTDKSSVMDGIHDLFLNLYKYHSKLGHVENLKAYLFRSLKRILQKKDGIKVILFENCEEMNRLHTNDKTSPSQESLIIGVEQSNSTSLKLNRALDLLTQNQQRVLQMRYDENKSYEEIANVMSVSIASARTIIYRALKIVRGGILILLFYLF
tara:strand:- start:105 stop:680 length:576 start_codon:yes stop_codon:yes gene_type:complete